MFLYLSFFFDQFNIHEYLFEWVEGTLTLFSIVCIDCLEFITYVLWNYKEKISSTLPQIREGIKKNAKIIEC